MNNDVIAINPFNGFGPTEQISPMGMRPETPETGENSGFVNYLLGHQVSSSIESLLTDSDLNLSNGNLLAKGEKNEDEPLLALFDRQASGREGLSGLMPGMPVATQTLQVKDLGKADLGLLQDENFQKSDKAEQFSGMGAKSNSNSMPAVSGDGFDELMVKQNLSDQQVSDTKEVSQTQRDQALKRYGPFAKPAETEVKASNDHKIDTRLTPQVETAQNSNEHIKASEHGIASNEREKDLKTRNSKEDFAVTHLMTAKTETQPMKTIQSPSVTAQAHTKTTAVPELWNRVESMVYQGGGRMTVTLSPPELGQVQVHVTTRGKNVEIEMVSDNKQAQSTLESQLGDLKQSLQSQDLNLSKVEVHTNTELDRSGLENSFAQAGQGNLFGGQQGSGNERTMPSWRNSEVGKVTTFSAPRSAPQVIARVAAPSNGRLDLQI